MKKLGLMVVGLMLVGLVAGTTLAELPKGFELSGDIELTYGYRSKDINVFHNAEGPILNDNQKSDFILSPLISFNAKLETADKVTAFVQFENRRLEDTAGTAANADFGGGDNIEPAINQAYIKVKGFLAEKLTITYGIQELRLTLREGEGAFFMDVSESMSPSRRILPPFFGVPILFFASQDMLIVGRSSLPRGTAEFSGFVFDYGTVANDNYALSFFWGVTQETGAMRANDKLLGAHLAFKLPVGVIKGLVAQISNSAIDMSIMTIGGGVDLQKIGVENLSAYLEAYTQSGTLWNGGWDVNGQPTDVDQSALAYRLGARYDLAHDLKPYVDLSYWYISGGDDSPIYKGDQPPMKYTESNHFVSYENTQSTMILEDHLFGLDLESNYTAIKVEAGIKTSLDINKDQTKESVAIKLLVGMFTLINPPYTIDLVTGDLEKTDKALGTEIDLLVTLNYTENLSFTLGVGRLIGGEFFRSVQFVRSWGLPPEEFSNLNMVTFSGAIKF